MVLIIGPSGIEMDLDPTTATGMVDGGHAEYVGSAVAVPEEHPADEPHPEATVQKSERPKGNASLEEWAAYATAHGKDTNGLTRDEIRALFKE